MAGSNSYLARPGQVERKWYIVDATDRPIGRLAASIARILTGKHRPTFTPVLHIQIESGLGRLGIRQATRSASTRPSIATSKKLGGHPRA